MRARLGEHRCEERKRWVAVVGGGVSIDKRTTKPKLILQGMFLHCDPERKKKKMNRKEPTKSIDPRVACQASRA